MSKLPRSVRNNNPGNLESDGKTHWEGQIDAPLEWPYLAFCDAPHGFRAFRRLLRNVQLLHGVQTIVELIAGKTDSTGKVLYPGFAPAKDGNKPESYIQFVSSRTGYPKYQQLNFADDGIAFGLMRAMSRLEAGRDVWKDSDIWDGIKLEKVK